MSGTPYISMEYDRTQSAVVNDMLALIMRFGPRRPNAILYLGQRQKIALHWLVAHNRSVGAVDDRVSEETFHGFPVVWVERDSHMHLAE